MAKNQNNDRRTSNRGGLADSVRERPFATAATAAGVAAAGAFLWSKRSQISEAVSNGLDALSEAKAQRFGGKPQSEIAEEALTLKETGTSSNQERKAGAKAYS